MIHNRRISFLIVTASYVAALAAGAGMFTVLARIDVLWRLAFADVAATLVIWLISLSVRNASVYDPYWSVAPPILLAGLMLYNGRLSASTLLLLILLLFWSTRLTVNWATGFQGLHSQDWRYTVFERDHPRLWPLINLFGIQLMPTAVVFAAMLPVLCVTLQPSGLRILTLPVGLFTVASVCLEGVADTQMREFRADSKNAGQVNTRGLWRLSRHPNYLGEILFWWGIYLTSLSMTRLPLIILAGPVVITTLFLFVSIPMMERRQINTKPGYSAYQRTTGTLLPRLMKERGKVKSV